LGADARINHYGPASMYECQLMRPNIRMQSCHDCQIRLLANEEESIYGRSQIAEHFTRSAELKAIQILLVVTMAMASGTSFAIDDTSENRQAQVDRYLEAVPPDELFAEIANSLVMNYPPSERAELRNFMMEIVNFDVVIDAMVASMVKHFTADETAAIAELYESPVGQSAMKKMGIYMAEVMPVIEAEVMRAVGELRKKMAEENRQLPDSEDKE
jgi:hypothetical protein